jgi:hypothetical protein
MSDSKSSLNKFENIPLKSELRILICGSRNWTNKARIGRYLDTLMNDERYTADMITVIHGGSKGADHHAGMEAKGRGIQVVEYSANWLKHGLRAGPVRNQQMIDDGKPDRVVAFHEDITKSKGTKDMVARAEFHDIPVTIITN